MARYTLPLLLRSRQLRGVVAITAALRADFSDHFRYPLERIAVLPDGAVPFPAAVVPAITSGDRFRIGYVGHLYPGKGMEVVAAVCGLVRWADFHIVGGRSEDLAYWRERLGAEPNVIFHGHVHHGDVPNWLSCFDAVILPNQRAVSSSGPGDIGRYTSPLKLFEYMAAGLPIVASDLPVLREVLREGSNALLCPCDDPAKWARALQRLRDEPTLRLRLGSQARADFDAGLSWDARASRILTLFDDVQPRQFVPNLRTADRHAASR